MSGTRTSRWACVRRTTTLVALSTLFAIGPALAADVVRPGAVAADVLYVDVDDVVLQWTPPATDALGQPETVASYRVWRSTSPQWPGAFVEIGTSTTSEFTAVGDATLPGLHFYLVTAVDAAGNEGQPRPGAIDTPPTIGGGWTRFTVELAWDDAQPPAEVASYRVYHGLAPGVYDTMIETGPAQALSLGTADLLEEVQYFFAVTAVDHDGAESAFSNAHAEAIGGTVVVRAHDEARICFGGGNCPPREGEIQHDSGRELVVPIRFPVGQDWSRVTLRYTVDSRLCNVANMCGGPPWNPCGDPWDRTTSVVLVMDDCVDSGARCYGSSGNLELLHAVTPFGTDADPPDGNGDVGPRVWNFDVTPYTPLFQGDAHIASFVGVWVAAGWYVTVDFVFTEIPQAASPKPPADGIALVSFKDGGNVSGPTSIAIPPTATQVVGRLFTTGHGGYTGPECACGSSPCDEFCQKEIQITVDETVVWSTVPWRTDCSPSGNSCSNWNACGFPSCTFPRSGWCPGYIACHHNAPCDQDLDLTPFLTPGGTYDVMVDVPQITTPGGAWANSLAIYWYE